MTSNFDFLKEIDKELFSNIIDAEKLFQDEYLNQCAVQIRVFSEKIAKKILGETSINLTFDDTINCLKDKIKTQREQEFIDDLFFIKKIGNKCAHGEDTTVSEVLETIHRAFEVAINYANSKNKNKNFDNLNFDDTLLVTGKRQQEVRLVDKYIERAQNALEEDLKEKDKEKEILQNNKEKFKSEKTIKKEKIKAKVKKAKKELKKTVNKKPKKPTQKQIKKKKDDKKRQKKLILFIIFYIISLLLLTKMIFSFLF